MDDDYSNQEVYHPEAKQVQEDYMQVEEQSNDSHTDESVDSSEDKPADYYLNNFGSVENPIVFSGEVYRFKPGI
jgi:hypothetical protein